MMQAKRRSSDFELLRIIAMLMIVLSHCVYYGIIKVGQPDAYESWNAGNLLYKGVTSLFVAGTIGVGLFFMISGYFLAHKENVAVKKVCLVTSFYAALAVVAAAVSRMGGLHSKR